MLLRVQELVAQRLVGHGRVVAAAQPPLDVLPLVLVAVSAAHGREHDLVRDRVHEIVWHDDALALSVLRRVQS